MRNATRTSWLIFLAVLIGSTALLRVVRSPWLAAVVIIGFVAIWLALTIVARSRSSREPERRRTKNVTPVEPALPPGTVAPPDPTADVVVLDPGPPIDELEAKLQVLERLRANGLVSEAEYEDKRARLIADF